MPRPKKSSGGRKRSGGQENGHKRHTFQHTHKSATSLKEFRETVVSTGLLWLQEKGSQELQQHLEVPERRATAVIMMILMETAMFPDSFHTKKTVTGR